MKTAAWEDCGQLELVDGEDKVISTTLLRSLNERIATMGSSEGRTIFFPDET